MSKMVCIAKVIEKVGMSWFEIWGEKRVTGAADASGLGVTGVAGRAEVLPKKNDIFFGGTLKLKMGDDDADA